MDVVELLMKLSAGSSPEFIAAMARKLENVKVGQYGYAVLGIWFLGPGIIAIQDSHNPWEDEPQKVRVEVDIYFDRQRFRFIRPDMWEPQHGEVRDPILGHLPSAGTTMKINTSTDAMNYIRLNLKEEI